MALTSIWNSWEYNCIAQDQPYSEYLLIMQELKYTAVSQKAYSLFWTAFNLQLGEDLG